MNMKTPSFLPFFPPSLPPSLPAAGRHGFCYSTRHVMTASEPHWKEEGTGEHVARSTPTPVPTTAWSKSTRVYGRVANGGTPNERKWPFFFVFASASREERRQSEKHHRAITQPPILHGRRGTEGRETHLSHPAGRFGIRQRGEEGGQEEGGERASLFLRARPGKPCSPALVRGTNVKQMGQIYAISRDGQRERAGEPPPFQRRPAADGQRERREQPAKRRDADASRNKLCFGG